MNLATIAHQHRRRHMMYYAAHPDAGLCWAVHWGWRRPAATGEAWSEPKTI